MVHGDPIWPFLFRNIAKAMIQDGDRVVMLDCIGMGMSDVPSTSDFDSWPRSHAGLEEHRAGESDSLFGALRCNPTCPGASSCVCDEVLLPTCVSAGCGDPRGLSFTSANSPTARSWNSVPIASWSCSGRVRWCFEDRGCFGSHDSRVGARACDPGPERPH